MKTILLPVDLTIDSQKALLFAIEIAKKSNAKIIVANAFYIPAIDFNAPSNIMEEIYDEEKKGTEKALQIICQKITKHFSENGNTLKAELIAEQSFPIAEITKLQKDKNVDLIIMETEGESHFFDLFGSTTIDVLNKVECPVLIVKANTQFSDFKKIYYAIEDVRENINTIKQIIPLAQLFNSEITIINANKYPETMRDLINENEEREDSESLINSIKETFSYNKISYKHSFSKETLDGLHRLINKDKPDLMVLLKHQRNWLENIFHKSTIKYLIQKETTPLLITHSNSK